MRTTAAFLLVTIATTASANDRFANAKIKTTHVGGSVYMLEGIGGNIGVSVGADGILMIDDQYAPLAPKIRAALNKLGKGEVAFLLNTHWHGDHVGGNADFGPEATIIAHSNVRERLSTPQTLMGRRIEAMPPEALPVITFDDTLSIHFNGEEIRALHLPGGHTDGDIVIFFDKSNVVHMGDLLFTGRFPFVDLDHGGNVLQLSKNIDFLLGQIKVGTKIIPGHGPLSDLDDVRAYANMLKKTTDTVRNLMADGNSLEQIQGKGLPEEWDEWGKGFINESQWIALVYGSLNPN